MNQVTEQAPEQVKPRRGPRVPPFGNTVDPVEAGRKGGLAAQEARRLRPLRELEAGIKASRNGAAKAVVYRDKRQELAALLERQLAADRMVAELDMEAESLRATINDLRGECDTLRTERAVLDAELKAAVESDTALVEMLRTVGELRVERACDELGWIEDDDAV